MQKRFSLKLTAYTVTAAILIQFAVMILGFGTSAADETEQNKNLIPNPGFEEIQGNMPASWETFGPNGGSGSIAVLPGESIDGSNALKISPDAGKQFSARPKGDPDRYDGVIDLEPSTYYVLTYTVKALSDSASIVPTIRQLVSPAENSNARPWYELTNYKVTGTGGEWKTVNCYFQTDSNTAMGNIWLIAEGGEMLVDNVSLTKLVEEGLLPNGHFERADANGGVADWESFAVNGGTGKTELAVGQGLDGSNAAHIIPDVGSEYSLRIGDNDMFELKPGTDYLLSYYVKCESENMEFFPTIRQMKNAEENSNSRPWYELSGYKITGTGGEWKKVEAYFTTDTDTTRGAVWLIARRGSVLIDDITLSEFVSTDGLVKNPGFERVDAQGIPAGWEGFGANTGTGKVETVAGAGVDGSMAAAIRPDLDLDFSLRTPDDPMIPVKPKTSYVLTYMYKGLEDTSNVRVMVPQRQSDMLSGTLANPFYDLSAYAVSGKTDDYIEVKTYFRTDEDAAYIALWFLAWGGDVLIDNVSLEERTETDLGDINECNLSFEKLENGEVKNWRAVNFDTISLNKETYHAGSQSVNLVGSSPKRTSTYTCIKGIPVDERHSYRFTVYVKSRNSTGAKVSLQAIGADKHGAVMQSSKGAETILSADSKYSDWTPITLKYTPAADVTSVLLQIVVSKSVDVDIIVDDVRVINLDEADYFERFEGVTEAGRPDDWFPSGSGKLEADGESLNITGKGEWTRRFTEFLSNKSYTVSGRLLTKGTRSAEVIFRYYDFNDKLITTKTETVRTVNDNVWTDFEFPLNTGSFTYVKVSLAGSSGTVCFDDFGLTTTSADIVAGSDWSAFWIWYSEDYSVSLNKYRYFRDTFELSEIPDKCVLQMTADDHVEMWINGTRVDFEDADDWESIKHIDITEYLQKGENLFAFRLMNVDYECGLLYEALPVNKNGDILGLIISDRNTRSSKVQPADNWNTLDYTEDETWYYSKEKGRPPINPWGIISYDATVKSANELHLESFEMSPEAKGGQTVTAKIKVKLDTPFANELISWGSLWKRNTLDKICDVKLNLKTPMTKWPVGKEFETEITFTVPDFIPEGYYTLQIDPSVLTITNDEYLNNKLENIKITQDKFKTGITSTSYIESSDGRTRLYIDGKEVSPMLFYACDTFANYKSDHTYYMADAGLDFLALMVGSGMNNAAKVWTGVDENGKNIYDWTLYDEKIYAYLSANPNARLMISFDASVPTWWAEKYPDEMGRNKDGSTDGASFASEKWREDMKQVISDLIDHLTSQPYAKYISAFRVTAGRTLEWLPWSDNIIDHSPATQEAFRVWLKEKYGTDAALQKAWNQPGITFDKVTEPDDSDRSSLTYNTLLDADLQMEAIDYYKFIGETTASAFEELCAFVKEKTDDKWIVGGYFGYLWNAYSYEANGTLSTSAQIALESPNVDFFSAPMNYDERQIGENSVPQSMIDSLTANGKLYISENDIRTVAYQTPYNELDASAHGQTYNMSDTKAALIRDFSAQLIKGSGMWWYDMGGGWFNDEQIYSLIEIMQEEMTVNLSRTRNSASDVAVFVDGDSYAYAAMNFGPTYNLYYAAHYLQRQQLATMGAPFDLYYLSDLENGKVLKDYKVNIIMNGIEIDESESKAIEKYLKKDGKTVIFNYMSGFSNGSTMSLDNITRLTGFENLRLLTGRSSADCVLNSTPGWCDGVAGKTFGIPEFNSVSPNLVLGDSSATVLGSYSDGEGASLAVKDMGDWTSVFAAVPDMPAALLRNILKKSGVHIYSENMNDIVHANGEYVSLHCRYGGEKTVILPANYAVYNVFTGETVSFNTNRFTFSAENNSSALFRLTPANKVAVTTYVKGKGGNIDPSGMSFVNSGGSLKVNVTPESGWQIKSLTVDGVARSASGGVLNLTGIKGNTAVEVVYERIPDYAPLKNGGNVTPPGGGNGNIPAPPPDNGNGSPVIPGGGSENQLPTPDTGSGDREAVISKNKRTVNKTVLNWPVIIGLICGAAAALIAAVTAVLLLVTRKNVIVFEGGKKICGIKAKNGMAKLDKAAEKCVLSNAYAVVKKGYVKKHSGEELKFIKGSAPITAVTLTGSEDFKVKF